MSVADQTDREQITEAIKRSLLTLHTACDRDPGVFEIRATDVGRVKTVSGYFDDLDKAAAACLELSEVRKAPAVYTTFNHVDPSLLARAANRLNDWPKFTTSDKEIARRVLLFIDLDPSRFTGISSTDNERAEIQTVAADIEEALRQKGWPYPIRQDSGNGFYLWYPIDLPADDATDKLLERFYEGLEVLVAPPPAVKIDSAVRNAARIARVGGTWNRKGDSIPARPHRRSIITPPDHDYPIGIVPIELIEDIAKLAPEKKKPQAQQSKQYANGQEPPRLKVAEWLAAKGIAHKTKAVDGGTAYLIECAFDSNHGANGESSIVQADTGLLTYHCMHNSCQGRTWEEAKNKIGKPTAEHYEGLPPKSQHSNGSHGNGNSQNNSSRQQTDTSKPTSEPPRFTRLITSRELLARDIRPKFLIKNILVEQQHDVFGGRSKTLKTLIAQDMAESLASATPFLGQFEVPEAKRVAFWSGESGAATLRDGAIRIAKAKGIDLAELSILWGFDLPKLARVDHLFAFEKVVRDAGIQVAFVDPLYLALLTTDNANQASNVYAMGSLLQPLGEIGQTTGCTIIVLHHFKRSGQADDTEPASLEMLSQAGIVEWARQWTLLARRSVYQADGRHELWMRAGGSAGHCGLWAVDVDEGIVDPETMGGRHWKVDVRSVSDAQAEAKRAAEARKAKNAEQQDDDDRRKMLETLRGSPAGETMRTLREVSSLSNDRASKALRTLIGDGLAEAFDMKKHTKTYQAYRLKKA